MFDTALHQKYGDVLGGLRKDVQIYFAVLVGRPGQHRTYQPGFEPL